MLLFWIKFFIFVIQFSLKKNKIQAKALINFGNKKNFITPRYTSKLGLKVYHTNIGAQKIDGSIFEIFEIVLANFQVENKLEKTWFF